MVLIRNKSQKKNWPNCCKKRDICRFGDLDIMFYGIRSCFGGSDCFPGHFGVFSAFRRCIEICNDSDAPLLCHSGLWTVRCGHSERNDSRKWNATARNVHTQPKSVLHEHSNVIWRPEQRIHWFHFWRTSKDKVFSGMSMVCRVEKRLALQTLEPIVLCMAVLQFPKNAGVSLT